MNAVPRTSVLVVGAGPTGLAAANLLASFAVKTIVVEQEGTLNDEPRAVSIDDEAVRLLQYLALLDDARSIVRPGTGTRFYGRRGQPLAISPAAERQPLGHPLKNPIDHAALTRLLCDSLGRQEGAGVRFRTKLSALRQEPDGVTATVSEDGHDYEIRADFVLGCDGGRSRTRRSLAISMEGASAPDRWLILDLRNDPHDQRFAMHRGDPGRPHVIVPGGEGRCRYEFLLLPGEEPSMAASSFDFASGLVRPLRGRLSPEDVVRQHVYEFHALVADRWRVGRVFLLGDAAHMMPPFAGQGLNTGLRDAANLCWKIASTLRRELSASALDSYELERRPNAEATVRYSQLRGRVMMTRSRSRAAVRDGLALAARAVPPLRRRLDRLPAKPHLRYRAGLILPDEGEAGIAGELLPQPRVLRADGTMTLLDEVLGPGFSMIGVQLSETALEAPAAEVWDRLEVRRIPVILGERFPLGSAVSTADAAFAAFLAKAHGLCVVIRPDRVVLGTFEPEAEAKFVERWQGLGLKFSDRKDISTASQPPEGVSIHK